MFPDIVDLESHRVREKVSEGRSPAQIAIWFASDAIAQVLSTYIREPLDVFMKQLKSSFILEIEEKTELISFITNNKKDQALDKLCTFLSRKSAKDIKEFQALLQTRTPQLADYLNSVIVQCEKIDRQDQTCREVDASK